MLPLGTVDLVWVGRLGEVGGAALVRRQGDAGDEWTQEQEERMQPGAQADTAQDAQLVLISYFYFKQKMSTYPDPVQAP